MSLDTPTKAGKKAPVEVIDDARRSHSPHSDSEDEGAELSDLRKRWIGQVDLPEREWLATRPDTTIEVHMTV